MDMASRRQLLQGLGAAGTVGLLGLLPERVGAEPPPETKRIRVLNRPAPYRAPQFRAGELLQGEGFTDIRYVKLKGTDAEEAAITTDPEGYRPLCAAAGARCPVSRRQGIRRPD